MPSKNNLHMVPEIVKNIAEKLNPHNKSVNENEKWIASQQIEIIRDYCNAVLKVSDNK